MNAKLHSLIGLFAALFIGFTAITGAFLSLQPSLGLLAAAPEGNINLNVAELAARVAAKNQGVEQILRRANGDVVASGYDDVKGSWKVLIDPMTGQGATLPEQSNLTGLITSLHRAPIAGDVGRAITGFVSLCLLTIAVSGANMLAKRQGGWQNLMKSSKGTFSQKLHVDVAKFALGGLIISSLTGVFLSMATFGLMPDGETAVADFPAAVAGRAPLQVNELSALKNVELSELRELTFPFPDDPQDVFSLTTNGGHFYVDQATGEFITSAPHGTGMRIYEFFYMLHAGQNFGWGGAFFGLLLGVSATSVPIMGATGVVIWWRRRNKRPSTQNLTNVEDAEFVLLVGSEGNTTWGFAQCLHQEIDAHGRQSHICAMNEVTRKHLENKTVLVLTSTYGEGDAPSSADKFMEKMMELGKLEATKFTVLGFGDKQFANYCGFAKQVDNALSRSGAHRLMDIEMINRQCPQTFKNYGVNLGARLGVPLHLEYKAAAPDQQTFILREIVKNKAGQEADIAIFRFGPANNQTRRRFANLNFFLRRVKFDVGDLIAITPPGEVTARYYSLASSSTDGFIEICVKRHEHGVCSNYLYGLKPGDQIQAYLQSNPTFKLERSNKPIVLIGAGTGVAPLVGFARHNVSQRPMMMFWGGRYPETDFVYKGAILTCLRNKFLTFAKTAFSRGEKRQYVQDRLAEDPQLLKQLVMNDAQIMVCGGAAMAASVRKIIDEAIKPLGQDIQMLKVKGKYVEDVY